jgi:integrase
LEADVFAKLGTKRPSEISAPEVLKLLRAVEARGALDVAKRVRQYISAIFRYAIATGRADRDPSADVKDALRPKPKAKHMAALTASQVGEFYLRLATYDGSTATALALELAMHTFVRTNELRFAKWSEFEAETWRIPGARMKMGSDLIVPLSSQVQQILGQLPRDSEWVLPGVRGPMSSNTMLYAMYRMGYHSRATVHGFRSLASTVLNESGLWSPDAIERQLAHVPLNQVRSAYNAAKYIDERTRMMQWWSDWLISARDKAE